MINKPPPFKGLAAKEPKLGYQKGDTWEFLKIGMAGPHDT